MRSNPIKAYSNNVSSEVNIRIHSL